jgi:hypothetical protein
MIQKIISGGQTGAARAALDTAIRHGIPHGGWCPKGRNAEDGRIGGQYRLAESPSANELEGAEWNITDTDGTVVLTLSHEVTGGPLQAIAFCRKHKKPYVHIAQLGEHWQAETLQSFVREHSIKTLNVAGSRESKEPGVWRFVYQLIEDAFFWGEVHQSMIGGPGEG